MKKLFSRRSIEVTDKDFSGLWRDSLLIVAKEVNTLKLYPNNTKTNALEKLSEHVIIDWSALEQVFFKNLI